MIPRKSNMDVAAGEPIPGSKYVRAFCRGCGAPMRVSKDIYKAGTYADCSDCIRPFQPGHGTQSATEEYDGEWDNAVRALEDAA